MKYSVRLKNFPVFYYNTIQKGERMRRFLLSLLLLGIDTAPAGTVRDYRPIGNDQCLQSDNSEWALLRRFDEGGRPLALAVNTHTLLTKLLPLPKQTISCRKDSRYRRLLRLAGSPPYPLQNDGIIRGTHGFYLTTDLCPSSKKGFEKRLYETIIRRFPRPVPVTLFITKRWISRHPAAFKTLRQWDRNGTLAITWGNHTAWHHFHPRNPLRKNFVLSPEENLTVDILMLEKTLITKGALPSVFFRFPGLVSDKKTVQTVTGLGLIPIGTDAWLAQRQTPKEGSIILVHGNGNEPEGVDLLLHDLKTHLIDRLTDIHKIDPAGITPE